MEYVWSCVVWAAFEPLSSYTNVLLGSITIDTLVVKGLMYKFVDESLAVITNCADTKFHIYLYLFHIYWY